MPRGKPDDEPARMIPVEDMILIMREEDGFRHYHWEQRQPHEPHDNEDE
jgi:hypothetical protein